HPDVHDGKIGLELLDKTQQLAGRPGATDDVHTFPFEQAGKALSEKDVVVGQHDSAPAIIGVRSPRLRHRRLLVYLDWGQEKRYRTAGIPHSLRDGVTAAWPPRQRAWFGWFRLAGKGDNR